MVKLRIKLAGIGEVLVEGDDAKQVVQEAAFWNELPQVCPICGAQVRLSYRHPQDYHFYGMICLGEVEHESTFGQHKKDGKLFYKGDRSWKVSPGRGEE